MAFTASGLPWLPSSRTARIVARRSAATSRVLLEATCHEAPDVQQWRRQQSLHYAQTAAISAARSQGSGSHDEPAGPQQPMARQPDVQPGFHYLSHLADLLHVSLPVLRTLEARQPQLLDPPNQQKLLGGLQKLCSCLGVDMTQVVNMVAKQPALLSCSPGSLSAQLQSTAAALGLSQQLTAQLVARQPELLEVPPGRLVLRAVQLATLLLLPPVDPDHAVTAATAGAPANHRDARQAQQADEDDLYLADQLLEKEMNRGTALADWQAAAPPRTHRRVQRSPPPSDSVTQPPSHQASPVVSELQHSAGMSYPGPAQQPGSSRVTPSNGSAYQPRPLFTPTPAPVSQQQQSQPQSAGWRSPHRQPQPPELSPQNDASAPTPGVVLAGLRVLARLPSHHFYEIMALPTQSLTQRLLALEAALQLGAPAEAGAVVALCPQLLTQPLRLTVEAWRWLQGVPLARLPPGKQQAWLRRAATVLTRPLRDLVTTYRALQTELGWPPVVAAKRIQQQPNLLKWTPEALHSKLQELSGALGVDAAATRLVVQAAPSVLAQSAAVVADKKQALAHLLGMDQEQVVTLIAQHPVLMTFSTTTLDTKLRTLGSVLRLARPQLLQLVASAPSLLARNPVGVGRQLDALQSLLGWTDGERCAAALTWPRLLTLPAGRAQQVLRELQLRLSTVGLPEHSVCKSAGERRFEVRSDWEMVVELASAWPEVLAGALSSADVAGGIRLLGQELQAMQAGRGGDDGAGALTDDGGDRHWVLQAVRLAARRPEVLKAAVQKHMDDRG